MKQGRLKLFGFGDALAVTGGGLLSHPSDTGDNEVTALWAAE